MTNPMTPARLKVIQARCEAATEGPWICRWTEDKKNYWVEASDGQQFVVAKPYNGENLANDARFITLARQDLPDCVAEIERLQGVLDEIAGVPEKYKEA